MYNVIDSLYRVNYLYTLQFMQHYNLLFPCGKPYRTETPYSFIKRLFREGQYEIALKIMAHTPSKYCSTYYGGLYDITIVGWQYTRSVHVLLYFIGMMSRSNWNYYRRVIGPTLAQNLRSRINDINVVNATCHKRIMEL